MSRYMLDTDISSYIIKENNQALIEKFRSHRNDDICISSITYAELRYGALNRNSQRLDERLNLFFSLVSIIDFGKDAADAYAEIRLILTKSGAPIGNMDMLIAACAKASNAVLVTNNQKHFTGIPDITLENWV